MNTGNKKMLNIYSFGAKGDGVCDDTSYIQKALDEASASGMAVYFPPGIYSTDELIVHPETVLIAEPKWGFSSQMLGNTILRQRFQDQECVLDVSSANASTFNGLVIEGLGKGRICSGILSRKENPGKREDAYRIERTKVSGFTGHAVSLKNVWCFTVRQSMFAFSGGDGLHMQGYDGFISDNWFSGNRGCGFGTEDTNCSVTMTGNRIEWNQGGGIVIRGGSQYNITGNYIDRSGKEGISLIPGNEKGKQIFCNTISCVGNVIYRSGKSAEYDRNAQVRLEKCTGVTFTGNSMCVGRDDLGQGHVSPDIAMNIIECQECSITGNTLSAAALKQLIVEKENKNCVIKNNPGSIFPGELLERNDDLPSTLAARKKFM